MATGTRFEKWDVEPQVARVPVGTVIIHRMQIYGGPLGRRPGRAT